MARKNVNGVIIGNEGSSIFIPSDDSYGSVRLVEFSYDFLKSEATVFGYRDLNVTKAVRDVTGASASFAFGIGYNRRPNIRYSSDFIPERWDRTYPELDYVASRLNRELISDNSGVSSVWLAFSNFVVRRKGTDDIPFDGELFDAEIAIKQMMTLAKARKVGNKRRS